MLLPAIAILVCLLLLVLIGLGPALWLTAGADLGLEQAMTMAGPVGLALLSVVGFPLVRFVAPATRWAWPVTLGLILISMSLAWRAWPPGRSLRGVVRAHRATLAWGGAGLLALWGVLAAPLLVRGLQYAIFRSNPSDAFVYMTLAETMRVVPWPTLSNGLAFTAANWAGLQQLALASPTALFSARFVAFPFFLGYSVNLAWMAEIARAPVYELYYAYHQLNGLLAFLATLALGRLLRLPRWLALLAGGAVAAGFWARLVVERDAGFQIGGLPLLLLAVYGWLHLEQARARPVSRPVALWALSLASLICICFPMGVVLAAGLAVYYLAALVQGQRPLNRVGSLAAAAGLTVVILAATGQLLYIVRAVRYSFSIVQGISALEAQTLQLLRGQGLAAVWGLAAAAAWPDLPARYLWPVTQAGTVLAVGVTALAGVAALFIARRDAPVPHRGLLALVTGLALLAAVYVGRDNDRAADKLFTYGYPLLILLGAVAVQYAGRVLQPPFQRAAPALAAGWLGGTLLLGAAIPLSRGLAILPAAARPQRYDVQALLSQLPAGAAGPIVVNVPRAEDWMFPLYLQFVFGARGGYFQHGLVIDNGSVYQNLYFDTLSTLPHYAVMLKSADYVGMAGLGEAVAETPDLILYRLTTDDLGALQMYDAQQRQAEAAKPLFPSLTP
jgi:hypothetical protein